LTLTYTAKDATSNITSTGTIRVTVSRSAPAINADVSAVTSGLSVTINVDANDTDQLGAVAAPPVISTAPKNGTAVVSGNTIIYTPSAGFSGNDTLVYRRLGATPDVCTAALSDTALVVITVNNRPPVGNPASISTFACAPVTINLLSIASDPEGGTLSVTITSNPVSGVLTVVGSGTYKYIPNTNFVGNDNFAYTVTDPLNATSIAATVSITISGDANPNTAPSAIADTDRTLVNQVVYTNVLANDSDSNSDPLSISITALGLLAPVSGTIQLQPNKLIKYTPNAGFVGTDTYQYKLSDTHPGCSGSGSLDAIALVTITVTALPTTLSGTVINDVDISGTATFSNISTTGETGTNANGSMYVYLTDNTNVILDRTPIDVDGIYSLSNVPSLTANLKLILSNEDLLVGATLTTGSLPPGYSNSTPLTRTLPTTTVAGMSGYDWGIYTNPTLSGGTIIGPANLCGVTGTPGPITSSANANGGSITATGYTYQWQSSITSSTSGFSNIAGATLTTYTPSGAITTTTYFKRNVTNGVNGTVFSNVVTVTLSPNPTVVISPATAAININANISLTASGATAYAWSPATGLSATNTATVTAGPLSTTFYTVTGTITTTGCTNTASITVTVIDPGVIGSNQNGCVTYTPAAFTSTSIASGADGITYQWQSSTTSSTAGFTDIASATATSYTPGGAITLTTYYRRVAISGGSPFNSNVVTATVNPLPSVTISPLALVTIQSGTSQVLTATGAVNYSWYPASNLSATNTATVTAGPLTITTFYTVTGTLTTTGCANTASITVTVINPGVIGTDQSNCGVFTPTTLSSTSDASGASGITYQWQSSTVADFSSAVTTISGATSSTYSPVAISTTTFYRRVATSGSSSFNSNVVTATVKAIPTISISPSSASIQSGSSQTLSASGALTYSWYPASNLSATNTATVTAGPLTITTTYTVTGIASTGCSNTAGVTVTVVSIGGLIPGTIGSDQTICSGNTPASFTSTTPASGGSGAINYQWQQSTDNVTFTNIISATSLTYGASALTQTTYYRRGASTSSDAIVYTGSVKVTVTSRPVITGGISGPCSMTKDSIRTFSVTAAPNATSYFWTLPTGWSGTSTTNSINVKAGSANGTISVVPFNDTCAGAAVTYAVKVIDYAKVTITGTRTIASGTNQDPVQITIQLIDPNGNPIICSGGKAILKVCTNTGTLSTVVDNNDGTYTSILTAYADTVTICGTIDSFPIDKKLKLTFTGPQGGIKGNGPILETETPKLTFTATAGLAPFTIIYRSAKSTKNDTLTNVTSGTPIGVALIPSTTLYTLVSIIDANGEQRNTNFIRDTATIIVVAPRIIVTLHADPAIMGLDSTWFTRLTLKVRNTGELDLTNVQVKLNLKDVFPSPVTYVLDSVRVFGSTVTINPAYDGIQSNDLFARLNRIQHTLPADIAITGFPDKAISVDPVNALPGMNSVIDNVAGDFRNANGIAVYGSAEHPGSRTSSATEENAVMDGEHSVYMFGPASKLPVGVEGNMFLYIHLKPNGYYEPFLMQAVALGTGSTAEATALATSLSNDNNDVDAHPEITKKGDPLPTVIQLIPNPVIGVSLSADAPVDQGNGTYNVLLSYRLKNYGNVNLQSLKLVHNLSRMIGAPSTFNLVSAVTTTGTLVPNPNYDGKLDSNILISTSEMAYKQEGTIQFTINITPNQFSALYRLRAIVSAFNTDINGTITDVSTDGDNPDPDGNKIPNESIITIIAINTPIPPLLPAVIGILVNRDPRVWVLAKTYCGPVSGVLLVPGLTTLNTSGGSGPYEFLWQSSVDDITFTDITNATDSIYTTGNVSGNMYFRRRDISDNQVAYTNSVLLEIIPVVKPVISASGPLVLPVNGSVTLTSTAASSYVWSNAATTRSILVNVGGVGPYTVTISNANGCPGVSDPVLVLPPPPVTVNAIYIIGSNTNPPNSGIQVTGYPGATLKYYTLLAGGILIPVPVLPGVPGVYTYYVSQTINGYESVLVPYTVTMIDKVADLEKALSKAPLLQADGSFLLSFTVHATNKRSELLDSVKIKDDLTKVFPLSTQYQVVGLKSSGKLISNSFYNGISQIELLANGSQLPALQKDSIEITLKVFSNGFSGTLNNVAELQARSPYGTFKVTSNDPTVSNGLTVRAPTKFILPFIDIFIPSGFSPNRDETNDLFVITRPFNTTISLEVFNRWGNLVFRAPEYKNDWGGKGNQPARILGEDLPDGTYYYIVLATDKLNGSVRKFAGFITLKR